MCRYFGERALLNDEPRAATVTAIKKTTLFHIGRLAFEEVLGPLQLIIDQDRKHREARVSTGSGLDSTNLFWDADVLPPTLRHGDFSSVCHISSNEVSVLSVVQHRVSGNVYTLRRISKEKLDEMAQVDQAVRERFILTDLSAPCQFIPNVVATMKDENSIMLLFAGRLAVEFHTLLEQPLSEDQAKFYAASVGCALSFLHQEQVMYRGVAPEFLSLDETGQLKLHDFRVSKSLKESSEGKGFTLCGTPEYLAPELVLQTGHSYPVDFWAVGILVYEMLCGSTPFGDASGGVSDASEKGIYERICNHKQVRRASGASGREWARVGEWGRVWLRGLRQDECLANICDLCGNRCLVLS